ncbi:MAG: hypothetical protein N2053_09665, partial [Chitinispirillaceae bacterium]|nr:hypothetical protein [Chitinispirillaceae bacterium]
FTDRIVVNRAWISADKESAFADSSVIRISCDTVIKPPPPDHIDIVTDTLVIDSTKDADFIRITLDEGTQKAKVYAVIRDMFGKICGKLSMPLWISRDSSVAVAEGNGWEGTIIKKGGGTTIIVVSDRNNPSLKPDSLAVVAVETPPWPVISIAVMYDKEKGDIIPDLLEIVLNDTFHTNQRLDSVIIEYKGEVYSYDRLRVSLNGNYIRVPITSRSGVDPQPFGSVKLIMTVEGEKKYVSKDFIDGVGPAITSVWLGRNLNSNYDTLRLTFSEDVVMQTILGQTLQIIKNDGKDTIVLTVLSFRGPEIYPQTEVIVTSESGKRPEEGDLVRLVPGEKGGTVRDRKGNLPHLLNPAVKIPERPGQLISGVYTDFNADGIVDAIFLTFSKDVGIDTMLISVKWGNVEYYNAGNEYLSYGNKKSEVNFSLPQKFKEESGIRTDGVMSTKIQFSLNEIRTGQVKDSAAPVIVEAIYKIADQNVSLQSKPLDTLIVIFSEEVVVASNVNKPLLFKKGEVPYFIQLQLHSIKNQTAVFLVKEIEGISYPENGDSVWINPIYAIGDSLTWQNNPSNRRVLLQVKRGALSWDVIAVPNPFNPYNRGIVDSSVTIHIINPVNPLLPVNIPDAMLSIYDQVGNIVAKSLKFEKTEKGPICKWNGTNRKGRIVGDGTYIGIVTVNDSGRREIKRIKIGIYKRK